MTLPGRPPRTMARKQLLPSSLIFAHPSSTYASTASTGSMPSFIPPSSFALALPHMHLAIHPTSAMAPTADEMAMLLKPTEEEQVALDAIRRLGSEIDTTMALEFLRGPQFGETSAPTSTSASDRGLPSAALSILKLWFLAHQSDPYPNKEEKERLLKETGLSMIQLKNWFSNIRKRHWHPIRTGTRRPRSHVEYVLLYGASARTAASPPTSAESLLDDESSGVFDSDLDRPAKMQRRVAVMD